MSFSKKHVQKLIASFKAQSFPIAIILTFVLLTATGVTGSSEGIYDAKSGIKTNDVLVNQPRDIRSDEWLFQTQQLYIQQSANYPSINSNIGLGQDMSLITDVPTRDVFTVFKPQNLLFFVLPFSIAFAAKWWLMSLLLCLGFYVCMNLLFPNKKLIVSLVSILLLLNPFMQWWYQSITILCVAFALFTIFFFIKLFDDGISNKGLVAASIGLVYSTMCFLLILYPSFQIPVMFGGISVVLGFLYYRYIVLRVGLKDDMRIWSFLLISIISIVSLISIFLLNHTAAISAMRGTEYPGKRNVSSGQYTYDSAFNGNNYALNRYMSAPVLGSLQDDNTAANFFQNQSEAATFIFINLFIVPVVAFYVLRKPRQKRDRFDYYFLATSLFTGLLIIRFFTPFFNLPFKFLLLNQVLNERAEIGLIVLCCVQLVILSKLTLKNLNNRAAVVTAVVTAVVFMDASLHILRKYPGFGSELSAILLCSLVGISVYLILRPHYIKIGISLFLVINVSNSVFINPLYLKSDSTFISTASNYIRDEYKDSGIWAVLDTTLYENLPAIAGKHSVTGVHAYPQNHLWSQIDSGLLETTSYNRFAHVVMSSQDLPNQKNFYSPQPDTLLVRLSCPNADKLNIKYVLSPTQLDLSEYPCLKFSKNISFPKISLTIYENSRAEANTN